MIKKKFISHLILKKLIKPGIKDSTVINILMNARFKFETSFLFSFSISRLPGLVL